MVNLTLSHSHDCPAVHAIGEYPMSCCGTLVSTCSVSMPRINDAAPPI